MCNRTFNEDTVASGMGQFLAGQHGIENRQKDILQNGDKYFNAHRNALNQKENKNVINNVKNVNVNKANVNANKMFGNNTNMLDFDSVVDHDAREKDELSGRLMYGNGPYKEHSRQENERQYRYMMQQQQQDQ